MAVRAGSNRTLVATVLVAAIGLGAAMILPSLLQAQNQPQGGGAAPTTGPAPARIDRNMQAMGRGFRGMRGQVSDASKNESTLSMLADFEREAVAAKSGVPPTIANLPEADRPAKTAAFKKEMIKLIRQALDAEDALLAGDNAKATEAITAMNATQTEGHTEFRPRRGGGGGGRGGDAGARRAG